MVNILINIAVQICLFIVIVYATGYLISLCNRFFYKCVNGSKAVCYATGIIGTPVHELSHALLCLVFFHKINEIKLFQIDEASGVLGYVNHSYNKRNPYQLMGNYFIGVAPIVVGSVVLYFLMMFLLPTAYDAANLGFRYFTMVFGDQKYSYLLSALWETVWGMIKGVFTSPLADWKFWVFIVVCFCISLHMNLSGADIKGSLLALPILIVIIVAINFILGFTPVYGGYLSVVTYIGCALVCFLLLSLVFSLFILVIGLIVFLIRKAIKRGH